jgi:hypothetical protein
MRHFSLHATAVAIALVAASSLAQASATHGSFVDVAGSVSVDGWNQLNRNRLDANGNASPLTEAQLVAGTVANVPGSGDAVLTRLSGSHYPAGAGLYGSNSVLTLTDSTLATNASTLVLQAIINNFDNPFTVTLSYNGGTQALAATSTSFVNTNTVADFYTYSWDLSGLGALTDYTITLGLGFSQVLAFQVDQVSAVPEVGTTAMMLAGLGIVGFIGRRRAQAAK